MALQTITEPVLTDSTGQDIVEALGDIKNAVQPINIYLDIEMTIPVAGWSENTPHTYTWLNQRVTTECGVEVHFKDGAENVDMQFMEYEKVPGGIRFEINQIPDAAVPCVVRIINAMAEAVIEDIDATLVSTEAVPQTANVEEALANHESRLTTAEGDIDDLQDDMTNANAEIRLRLKSVNGVPADENGDVLVNETEYTHQIVTDDAQQSTGTFLFRTTGGDASLSDGSAMLVSIAGRSTHTGEIAEVLNLTVHMEERQPEEEGIEAEIDRDTFIAGDPVTGTITLTYSSNAWSENPATYGVTVTGNPIENDSITINYVKASRGLITNCAPTKFTSTGWNLYNHSVGYAKVKKYSDSYGFKIGGSYATLEFSETLSGSKIEITPASGYFTVPSDGYVWVTGGSDSGGSPTYIFMTWSDWTEGYEGEFKTYEESTIDLAGLAIKQGTSAATTFAAAFPNGMFQVGAIHDEINFSMMRVISRIERMTYSAANMEYAEQSGRAYDADESYIYLARDTEVVYVITTTTGAYTACDHGQEIIDGGTVEVFVSTLYGQNLVDKLRTDVVTKSQDIVNDLTTGGTSKALSAEMGKTLNSNIAELSGKLTSRGLDNSLSTGALLTSVINSPLGCCVWQLNGTDASHELPTNAYYPEYGIAFSASKGASPSGARRVVMLIDFNGNLWTNYYTSTAWNGWKQA